MKRLICILISCLIGGMLLAEASYGSICETKETVVFFGNGIKTAKLKAFGSRGVLKERLKAVLPAEEFELLDFKLSYNDTGGAIRDLFESTIQSLTLDASRFWRILFGHAFMPDWFADYVLLLATALDTSALVTTDSLKDHVSNYTTKIAEGKKVLLVAHSQGNFFGNQAYNLLDGRERQSFAMVSVANPDSNVLGNNSLDSPYTTLINDKVIQAVIAAKILLPSSPMKPLAFNQDVSDDPLQHNFIDTYMVDGSNSNAGVLNDILAALGLLITPPQIVEPGVINVALNWGPAPDIDLHVYEPYGTHVYWYNRQGDSGELDRDDRSGYGPEHYNVKTCEMIQGGQYRIALDYYKGSYSDVATVQIDAGLVSRTFTVSMPSDDFGTTSSPVPVATIIAQKNSDDVFEFSIHH